MIIKLPNYQNGQSIGFADVQNSGMDCRCPTVERKGVDYVFSFEVDVGCAMLCTVEKNPGHSVQNPHFRG